MTIKLTISNDDTRETAVVQIRTYNQPSGEPANTLYDQNLAGGQSAEVWVHSGMSVEVTEISQ